MTPSEMIAALKQSRALIDSVLAELNAPVVTPTPTPVPAPAPTPTPTPAPTPKPVGRAPEVVTGAVAGLDYAYHEGSYNKLPDFTKEKVVASGTVAQPTLSIRKRDEGWATRLTGYVLVPTEGKYAFYVASDDGSRLRIGTQIVVDNDAIQGTTEKSGEILLQKGLHPIIIEYFNYGGPQELVVSYAGPGIAKQVIPAAAYFRVAKPVVSNLTVKTGS